MEVEDCVYDRNLGAANGVDDAEFSSFVDHVGFRTIRLDTSVLSANAGTHGTNNRLVLPSDCGGYLLQWLFGYCVRVGSPQATNMLYR